MRDDNYAIPLYEPTAEAGERYKKQRRRQRKPYDERWHGHAWRKPGEPEKYPCPKDAFYHQWDTDVLEVARLYATWFGKGEYKRPHYDAVVRRACELLGVYKWLDPVDKRLKWRLQKDWQRRLIACGINPNNFQIADVNRWSRAWEYLKCEFRCPIDLMEQEILNGVPAPEYRPFTWSQSLRAQTGRHYNEYGPRPRKGNELISRNWIEQVGQRVGMSETEAERRQRIKDAGRPNMDATPIPLTSAEPST